MRQVASIESLKEKYGARGVEFVVVYVEDPHPGEPGYREFTQPQNHEERTRYAERLVSERAMDATVVVDEMDDRVSKQYGSLPNMVYVIDPLGKVAYHATWTMPEKIERVLDELSG